jgi:hypothetical protein
LQISGSETQYFFKKRAAGLPHMKAEFNFSSPFEKGGPRGILKQQQ